MKGLRETSPWGMIDHVEKVAEGIHFVSTSSHGGFELSPERLAKMPACLRMRGGWYEEDCEASKVVCAFPEHFDERQVKLAIESLKNWFPDVYEEWTGESLQEGESFIRDKHLFIERHRSDYVATAAWGSWEDGVPEGMVKVFACKGGDRRADDGLYFLVPEDEYAARGRFGFVVDQDRHKLFVNK